MHLAYPFTHYQVTLRVFAEDPPLVPGPHQTWCPLDNLETLAMAAPHRRAVRQLTQAMNPRQRKFAVAALLLFVSAVLTRLEAGKILHEHRLTVVDHPIRLEAGLACTYPFKVDVATSYQIELTCRQNLPAAVLYQALNKDLAADYEVSCGNDRIAGADTLPPPRSGGTSGDATRFVGKFQAQPGPLYLLRLHFSNSLPVLAATQPTVKVSVDPVVSRPVYARAQFASVLSMIFALLGFGVPAVDPRPLLLAPPRRPRLTPPCPPLDCPSSCKLSLTRTATSVPTAACSCPRRS